MRTIFAAAIAVIIGTAVSAQQEGGDQAPGAVSDFPIAEPGLTIGTTGGDYFLLAQPPNAPFSNILVRPIWSQAGDLLEIERMEPGNPGLRSELSINWRATAVCGSGLRQVRIAGPGGSIDQDIDGAPLIIEGTARYQSFDLEAAEQVCFDWLQAIVDACVGQDDCLPTANPHNDFVFGPENPLPGSTPISISSTCVSGVTTPPPIVPRLVLRCRGAFN